MDFEARKWFQQFKSGSINKVGDITLGRSNDIPNELVLIQGGNIIRIDLATDMWDDVKLGIAKIVGR